MLTERTFLHLKYNNWKYGAISFAITTVAVIIMLTNRNSFGLTFGKSILALEAILYAGVNLVYRHLKKKYEHSDS